MVLELVPYMPEIIEEAAAWQPVTYIQHFAASVLSDRELAIWAYENAPKEYIDAFEELVAALDTLILRAVTEISQLVDTASGDELRDRLAGHLRGKIGRAHVRTLVNHAHLLCRLLLEQKTYLK